MLVDNLLLPCYLGTHLSRKVCQDSMGCHLLSEGKIAPSLSLFPSFQTNSLPPLLLHIHTHTHTHAHTHTHTRMHARTHYQSINTFFHCLTLAINFPPPLPPLISSLSVVVRQESCMLNSWSKRGLRKSGAEKRREGERKRDSGSWRDWRERRRRRTIPSPANGRVGEAE